MVQRVWRTLKNTNRNILRLFFEWKEQKSAFLTHKQHTFELTLQSNRFTVYDRTRCKTTNEMLNQLLHKSINQSTCFMFIVLINRAHPLLILCYSFFFFLSLFCVLFFFFNFIYFFIMLMIVKLSVIRFKNLFLFFYIFFSFVSGSAMEFLVSRHSALHVWQ